MCRNITVLRTLDPPVTDAEIADAARQFIKKVAALTSAQLGREDVTRAIDDVARATKELLVSMPARRVSSAGPASRRHLPH